jgi:Spx/MgsR family transcriptional regulator
VSITLHGIPNCDTVKKARAFLKEHGVACEFVDFKKQGVSADKLAVWMDAVGWERLLNRQGSTWRALDEAVKASVVDADSAAVVMTANPSCIKRPVVEWGGGAVTVGFSEPQFLGSLPLQGEGQG